MKSCQILSSQFTFWPSPISQIASFRGQTCVNPSKSTQCPLPWNPHWLRKAESRNLEGDFKLDSKLFVHGKMRIASCLSLCTPVSGGNAVGKMLSRICKAAISQEILSGSQEQSTTGSEKLRVGLICGGPSQERGISLNSARSVLDHLQVEDIVISCFYLDTDLQAYAISDSQATAAENLGSLGFATLPCVFWRQ